MVEALELTQNGIFLQLNAMGRDRHLTDKKLEWGYKQVFGCMQKSAGVVRPIYLR